uniref:Alpha/beta hydrolase fold protein n=1 Tax=Simulacricoccus ruber TaxID=2303410 RepID=A0A3Q8I3I1_9BACT|nr:alpha/beta hydrolase fold protein [Simulacricoccus ruber]
MLRLSAPLPHPLPPPAASPVLPLRGAGVPLRVDLDGEVHGVDYGGSGPTLLLLHGLGGSHLNWLPAAPLLAAHGRVLAVDLLGFGRTPHAGRGVGVRAQQALVHRFITEVVKEPVVLVGNSFGGLVALAQAAEAPETVSGLVLVSPAQRPAPGTRLGPVQLLRLLLHTLPGLGEYLLWRDGRRGGARKLFLDVLTLGCADVARVPADVVEQNVALIAERMARMPLGHAASYLQATRSLLLTLLHRQRFEDWVQDVCAPTLLVHGQEDRLVPLAFSQELARQRPDWHFRALAGVGHVPQMEDAERFVGQLAAWLPGSRRPASAATA